jgi:DNA polymerase-3 subunit beta
MSVIASDQTHRIRLSFNAGMLKFSVQTPDLGEAPDELPIRFDGDPLDIGFNAATCSRSCATCPPTRCA